jgi:hypothetical protein
MDSIGKIIIGVEGLIFVIVIVILIYLVIRRIRIKETENFEDRDN